MLLSLWLVPGRFFRPEYMNDLLLLLAVLNVRLACLFDGAAALRSPPACDCLDGALDAVSPPVCLADDSTSKSSSSSAPSGGCHFSIARRRGERSENGRVVVCTSRRLSSMRARHPSADTAVNLTCR